MPVVRDPAILALGDCVEVQGAATWVLSVLEKLEELARLPSLTTGCSGKSLRTRLKWTVRGLFASLATPRESASIDVPEETEITFHGHHPYRVLALTETGQRIRVGQIIAPSSSHATIFLARSVLAALNRMPPTKPLPPLRRVRKVDHTSMKPPTDSRPLNSILDWIRQELSSQMLDGVYDAVLGEMHAARRFLKEEGNTPTRKVSHHTEAIRAIQNENGELGEYARLVLVALYAWEEDKPNWDITREVLALEVKKLQGRVGMVKSCAPSTVAKQLRGLKLLGFVHQQPYQSAHLSRMGREWVKGSDLYKQDMAS